jgi:Flp pilus assembly pilin Flp
LIQPEIQLETIKRKVAESPEEGQALIEYALIIGSIALLAVGALGLLGENVGALLDVVASGFGGV